MDAPRCSAADDDIRFGTGAEPFEAETFVAELAVETLRDAILPRFVGIDQRAAESCATIEDRPLSLRADQSAAGGAAGTRYHG